jgi:hypothetical protein
MKTQFELAEYIFDSGDYMKAFEAFKNITIDDSSSVEEKSDAFNMMGVIVLVDTRVENNDESGLEYFIKSIDLNPHNADALLNILEGFGLSVNNHKNIDIIEYAIRTLKENNYSFSEEERKMIEGKIKIKEKIIKEGQ